MRKLYLDRFIPGMRVARTIYSADGQVLLQQGAELKASYLDQLRRRGITVVYIRDAMDEIAPDVVPEDVITTRTRVEATQIVQGLLEDAREQMLNARPGRRLALDTAKARQAVERIVREVLENRDAVVNLSDIRGTDEYTFHHSVNVCVLAVMTGATLLYDEAKLLDVGVGALLHDLGKVAIRPEVLRKEGTLTLEEFEELKRHTTLGFEMLWGQENLSVLAAHMAYQHHEREDGSGYPRNLVGREIHDYGKLCAVCDVYDALTTDRPYRRAFLPSEACRMMTNNPHLYDSRMMQALFQNIALYPLGSVVRLSTGEAALVVRVRKGMPERCVVRVVLGPAGRPLAAPRDVDLLRERDIRIVGPAPDLQALMEERLRRAQASGGGAARVGSPEPQAGSAAPPGETAVPEGVRTAVPR